MFEPDCDFSWCNFKRAKHVAGPGKYGQVLTTGGKTYSLNLEGDEEAEEL
jgi:hypothetical protein